MTYTEKNKIINIDNADRREDAIQQIVDVLTDGGIVAMPTDTVYGFCCHYENEDAKEKIAKIKQQPKNKPFQTLVGSISEAEKLCGALPKTASKLARSFWPGALTIIVNKEKGTIGLRLPADQDICAVTKKLQSPLSATSINIHGCEPLNNREEIVKQFGNDVDLIVVNNKESKPIPSTVVKVENEKLTILREGSIDKDTITNIAKTCFLFYFEQKSFRAIFAAIILNNMNGGLLGSSKTIVLTPEISMPANTLPKSAETTLTEMGYKLTLPKIKPTNLTDIDTADYIFTFSDNAFNEIVNTSPWQKDGIIKVPIKKSEIPKPSIDGFGIGPGYKEDIIYLEKEIWKIHQKIKKKI